VQGFEDGIDPLTRIYLDDVPIKNRDGSFNYTINGFFTGSPASAQGKGSLIPAIATAIPGLQRNNATGAVDSIVVDYRVGTQDQDPMPGFDDIKAEQKDLDKYTYLDYIYSRTNKNIYALRNKFQIDGDLNYLRKGITFTFLQQYADLNEPLPSPAKPSLSCW
jgi:hypothetical protein